MKKVKLIIAVMFVGLAFMACDKLDSDLKLQSEQGRLKSLVDPVDPEVCGIPQVFTLWVGQTIDIGTVTVSNDDGYLYVTYTTSGDWWLKQLHLYVLTYEPTEQLIPVQSTYGSGDISYLKSYTFIIGINEVECETALWLQGYVAVVKKINGEVVEVETAYGGNITSSGDSWFGNIMYTVQCCDDEPCYEFIEETAWAAGNRYVAKGNWATYTPYVPDQNVTLFAGKTIEAGTVHFSAAVDGYITITITLSGDWEFADMEENVKIQDYEFAPSGNPEVGLFTWKGTAEGTSFSIDVPENNFYGVHADVGYIEEVECPVEE